LPILLVSKIKLPKESAMEISKENLTIKIELFREEMIKSGLKTGFGSPETVQISQTLDALILKYQESIH
jgi:hypothetical protein